MDVKTSIKGRLPSRQPTEGGSTNAALRHRRSPVKVTSSSTAAEIFKKTPCVADLKPRGRYVAKDMGEIVGIPLLMKTLLDNGYLHGDCLTVTGRTNAENLKSAKRESAPGRGAVRRYDRSAADLLSGRRYH